jgi:hypothetical protein
MALMQQIAGVSVDGSGQLIEQPGAIGAASSLNVPPTAIPLPKGYPAGLPAPYLTGGKIQFTPIPPNFDPSPEQVAWMMWALQVWVLQYGQQKYNVFQWRYHTDGSGSGIASFVAQFCNLYNPDNLKRLQERQVTLMFDHYKTQRQVDDLNAQIFNLRGIMNFDFGNPPPPFTPSEIDKIFDGIAVTVLKIASNLLPVIGPVYASYWLKDFTGNEGAVFDAQSTQAAQGLAQASQQQGAMQVAAAKKKRLTQALIGAGILLALWVAYDND